jgi:hypothetical protein
MWTHRAALPPDLLLVACRAYGRSDVALRRDFAGVEINRIGDHRPFYSHYEEVVLLDALHRVLRAGVTEEALEVAWPRPTASASRGCPRRTAIPVIPGSAGPASPAATRSFT